MSCRTPLAVLVATVLGGGVLLSPAWVAGRGAPARSPASLTADAALTAVIDPALKAVAGGGRQPVILMLRPPLRGRSAPDHAAPDRSAPDRTANDAAKSKAAFIQRAAPLLGFLDVEAAAGRAGPAQALRSIDSIAAAVSPATLRELSRRPDIRAIIADGKLRLEPPAPSSSAADSGSGPHRATAVTGAAVAAPQWNLRQIKVDEARRLLDVDGSGITIAVVDSGVDYHHPLLQPSYRGTQPDGSLRHARNWWCNRGMDAFCGLGDTYPVDSVGHGTHVLGTIVAPAGIGVAPGARWIAARACQVDGCPLSWMVAALEWITDLGEDRPDIVNLSLGTAEPLEIGVYQQAVNRVVEAGIFVVAAMGNNADILLAPAAFTTTVGVGAVTAQGQVWNRSARGISTWQETKPDVMAPGVGITSTLPGGGLGRLSGTSMASPHVAGVAALILQARPGLKPAAVKDVLRRTATPLGATIPGRDSGWGLVNAYAAVASVSDVGQLRGQVLRAADGEPIVWARITVASPIGDPMASTVVSPSDGSFALDLHPGSYVIVAEAFGFRSRSQRDVRISTGQTTRLSLALDFDEPMGILEGRILDDQTGAPLDGTIRLAEVPFSLASSVTFGFSQRLPERSYDLRVERFGYRVLTDTVKVSAAAPASRIYRLQRAPRILLVDGDAWIYSGAVDLYRSALDRMGYLYDVHSVTDDFAGPGKPGGPPTTATMARYDLVIWASPLSSPNKVMGAYELGGYLAGGGRLIISGQDLLCQDSGREVPGKPCNENGPVLPYVRDQLLVRVVADRASGAAQLSGETGGPLAGLHFTLNDAGGLKNQSSPDALELRDEARGRLILRYGGGQGAAALVDTCTGYRAAVLGFGLEGIGDTAARAELLDRLIQALMAPAPAVGLHAAASQTRLVQPAGGNADYRLTVLNTGAAAAAYTVSLAGDTWPAELRQADFGAASDGRLQLAACQSAVLGLRVRIPAGSAHGDSARTEVRIQRAGGGAPKMLAVETRTPAPLLVVDGDYGSDSEQRYLEALDALGLPYDHLALGLLQIRPSLPPTRTLRSYPMVLWFTGYSGLKMDRHFGPEIQRLMADYLDSGGRLLLSSEDYLYHWAATPYRDALLFHRERLGVESFEESAGQAHQGPLVGAPGSIYHDLPTNCRLAARPQAEDFSDRLILRQVPLARAAILNALGEPIAAQYELSAGFKTVFLAFDAATLVPACAERVIGDALDWFNPWTASALEQIDAAGRVVPPGTYRSGDLVRLRLRLSHTGPAAEAALTVLWTLPDGAQLEASPPLPPGWSLVGRELRWSGKLPRFQEQTFILNLRLGPDLPRALEQVSQAAIASDNQTLRRRTVWRVNAPDLRGSSKSVPDDQRIVRPGQAVKFIINLANSGTEPSGRFVLTDTLPSGLELLPERILAESGTVKLADTRRLIWEGGGLPPGSSTSLVYSAQVASHRGGWLTNRAELREVGLPAWWMEARVFVRPELIFPWLGREPAPDP